MLPYLTVPHVEFPAHTHTRTHKRMVISVYD